jgi:peptidoglycan/LPS O-acetylase OafA/YrhL
VRNRYLDLLRAAAIVRVIVYHLFGWPWLSIVLPAMGIMFALAGSLTAASLDKRAAGNVVTSRLRRLLPPLWLLGLIAVPVMLAAGWAAETDGEHPFSPARLAFWLLPLGDPPGSDKGIDAWEPLWYIRAYVWFILLSPLLYALYRRVGWAAVAAPILLMAVLDKTGFSLPDTADAAMWDFVTYGACWIAGFAHHDGRLARLRPAVVFAGAVVLGAAALYWLSGHQGEDAWDLNDVSESQALWSLAFVLLALRWQPPMDWLARVKPVDRAVTLLNARAVTIYLWHNIAIAAVWPVLTFVALDDIGHHLDDGVDLAAALLLTLVAVLAFGWAEDLAARRRPRLWPTSEPTLRPAGTAAQERQPALVGADPTGAGQAAGADQRPQWQTDDGQPDDWHLDDAQAGDWPADDRQAGDWHPDGRQPGDWHPDDRHLDDRQPGDWQPGEWHGDGGRPAGGQAGDWQRGEWHGDGGRAGGGQAGDWPVGGEQPAAGTAMRRVPAARPPVPWTAEQPAVAGPPGRAAIAGTAAGRHAAHADESAGWAGSGIDLGLPVAGRPIGPMTGFPADRGHFPSDADTAGFPAGVAGESRWAIEGRVAGDGRGADGADAWPRRRPAEPDPPAERDARTAPAPEWFSHRREATGLDEGAG